MNIKATIKTVLDDVVISPIMLSIEQSTVLIGITDKGMSNMSSTTLTLPKLVANYKIVSENTEWILTYIGSVQSPITSEVIDLYNVDAPDRTYVILIPNQDGMISSPGGLIHIKAISLSTKVLNQHEIGYSNGSLTPCPKLLVMPDLEIVSLNLTGNQNSSLFNNLGVAYRADIYTEGLKTPPIFFIRLGSSTTAFGGDIKSSTLVASSVGSRELHPTPEGMLDNILIPLSF